MTANFCDLREGNRVFSLKMLLYSPGMSASVTAGGVRGLRAALFPGCAASARRRPTRFGASVMLAGEGSGGWTWVKINDELYIHEASCCLFTFTKPMNKTILSEHEAKCYVSRPY